MNAIKQKLLTNWHLMRIVRMTIGVWLAIWAYQAHDMMMGLFGAFFLFQGLTDTGCCGTAGCYTPPRKETTAATKDIEYEEIK